MMRNLTIYLLGAAAIGLGGTGMAEIINGRSYLDGVTVTASSVGQNRVARNTVNEHGLNPLTGECMASGSMAWMSDDKDPLPAISFDLGASYDLALLHLWNYNEGGYKESRTIKTAEIYTAADTTPNWVSRGTFTFAQAPGSNGYLGEDIPLMVAGVRMVKIHARSTGGDPFHGLSKVRFAAAGLLSFGLPNLPATIQGHTVTWEMPSSMNVTRLAPVFTLSAGASAVPPAGTPRDFTTPQAYTVRYQAGKPITVVYQVAIKRAPARTAKDFETFALLPGQPALLFGPVITMNVPPAAVVTALAPTFTLSPGAHAVPASGTPRDFTTPQQYVVTAEDGTTKNYTVKVSKSAASVVAPMAWHERVPAAAEKPVNHQFYARGGNNEGTLHYNGTFAGIADTVFLKVYADDKLCDFQRLKLKLDKSYAFSAKLKPGLVHYKVEFGSLSGTTAVVLDTVSDLVCGDVYLIQGQSNAEATQFGNDDDPSTSEWIRSYGKGWGRAAHLGNPPDSVTVGYWGLEVGRHLVRNYKIPICIFNGAVGGTRIDQHQRNAANHADPATIYGNLLACVQQAKLTHGIRGVCWHQGEQDQGKEAGWMDWTTYQDMFQALSKAWEEDFPNIKYYYIFQIWPGACGTAVEGSENMLREVQRTLPRKYNNMSIMSTIGVRPGSSCHYVAAGYADMARLLTPLIERDNYGATFTNPITPPDLKQATYAAGSTKIALEFDQPVIWKDELKSQFFLDGVGGQVTAGAVAGNVLTLTLKAASSATTITYLNSRKPWREDNILYGQNSIAALTFYEVPIGGLAQPAPAGNQAPGTQPAGDQSAGDPDSNNVRRAPIPDRLVVLTFDDACASGYTVVAPLLKSLGFNGTFYICDFDSFKTRKDWYMTWRQMTALDAAGFEIGNHTVGHGGGLANYLHLEDELLANHGPKPTTVCWPLYQADSNIFTELGAHGYIFGRGGHDRPYRPTVDNPLDVPSFTIKDDVPVEKFIKQAQQACHGRVVVFTFHGVPDIEHHGVSLQPATFKAMMQYLKDNNYQVIAMRDLARFIDPAKAAQLPPTTKVPKDAPPFMSLKDDHPYVATTTAEVKPRPTPEKTTLSKAKEMLTLMLPGQVVGIIAGNRSGVYVPTATDVTAMAPTFTLSPMATAVPASGTPRDFTQPQNYIITAQDGSTQTCTVTVVKSDKPHAFTWNQAADGSWSDATKWTDNRNVGSAPDAGGHSVYVLNFTMPGKYTVTNDLRSGFQLNQLNLGGGKGGGMIVAGDALTFVTNKVTGTQPGLNKNALFTPDLITASLLLADDLAVNVVAGGRLTIGGAITGSGRLIYNGNNRNADLSVNGGPNQHYSSLTINNSNNTYNGGTIINGGTLIGTKKSLGTGPITLNNRAGLVLAEDVTNALILNGGTIDASGNWSAPITLNGNTWIAGNHLNLHRDGGGITGPGGLTVVGTWGGFSRMNDGELALWGANAYRGPTTVHQGTLCIKKVAALYHADIAQWTPAQLSVHPAATLIISAGGPGEFTGAQLGTLLENLTELVANNGLLARSICCLDTTNATTPVTVANSLSDSKGLGGGAFVIKKCGPGSLQFAGNNTYTGQTVLEAGTLSVASLNSVANGRPASNLGVPPDVEAGEIVIGKDDADCTLLYTGPGETSDRVMNLAGKNATITFDQAGSGLLKLTSQFVISGYGTNKTIVLKGDTAGSGELAANITNPHDRAGQATTAITKAGSGTWVLSGSNNYSGPTMVTNGTLVLATTHSLSPQSEVHITTGATLELNFTGELHVAKLYLDNKLQPAGSYSNSNARQFIKGTGVLKN